MLYILEGRLEKGSFPDLSSPPVSKQWVARIRYSDRHEKKTATNNNKKEKYETPQQSFYVSRLQKRRNFRSD